MFNETLATHGLPKLRRGVARTLQVNLGKRCNQACTHCHVEAGPHRTESMDATTVERLKALMRSATSIRTLDLTGGAPELNPFFEDLVREGRALGLEVIDRCNLTVFFEPGMQALPAFLAEQRVRVVASLPCYTESNVDAQRGRGVYLKSIDALKELNTLGYGRPESGLVLDLVYNPGGAFLPGDQAGLEADYKARLSDDHGIVFNHLLTMTNLPIKRFADQLLRRGEYEAYMELLVSAFNPSTVDGVMCRDHISVGWDGKLYDCDFNQMLELGVEAASDETLWTIDHLDALADRPIVVGPHCYGCTAGSGASCGGALV